MIGWFMLKPAITWSSWSMLKQFRAGVWIRQSCQPPMMLMMRLCICLVMCTLIMHMQRHLCCNWTLQDVRGIFASLTWRIAHSGALCIVGATLSVARWAKLQSHCATAPQLAVACCCLLRSTLSRSRHAAPRRGDATAGGVTSGVKADSKAGPLGSTASSCVKRDKTTL